jgi:Transposase and inactivated derivatives
MVLRQMGTVPLEMHGGTVPTVRHRRCSLPLRRQRRAMPRRRRIVESHSVQHVVNRGNARHQLFRDHDDYEEFVSLLATAAETVPVPLLAYCLMPNHWHLVLRPPTSAALSAYMRWLTSTHVRRTHLRRGTRGLGHLYQGRYYNVVVSGELHFLSVCRYVESNALRAGLVERAELWPFSSLSRTTTRDGRSLLSEWPSPRPDGWLEMVNLKRR